MKYVPGEFFEQEVGEGTFKEVPDIGYHIPDAKENQYYLDNLFSKVANQEYRISIEINIQGDEI